MEHYGTAAREAARHALEEAPLPEGVSPDCFVAVQISLSKALADAASIGLLPPLVLKAAEAARAALVNARAVALSALAAAHNDGTAGIGDEGCDGPRLIPLHISVLSMLVNGLHSDRCE